MSKSVAFTRRHYETVAAVLAGTFDEIDGAGLHGDFGEANRQGGKAAVLLVTHRLAHVFEQDNARFDAEKFFAAVLGLSESELQEAN